VSLVIIGGTPDAFSIDPVSDVSITTIGGPSNAWLDFIYQLSDVLSPISVGALSKMSLIAVGPVSDVASSPVSVDPLAYIIAVAGKNNEDIIKSNSKLVIWFIIPLFVANYINIYHYEGIHTISKSEIACGYANVTQLENRFTESSHYSMPIADSSGELFNVLF
jgi:hypothetical protein